MFKPAPQPVTPLARHRILSPTAGIRVSPLCLGAMNFGNAWKEMMGECSRETTFEILDFFHGAGGNFIDTANAYQNNESETWLGEWMKERGLRDQMVIATKYTTSWMSGQKGEKDLHSNYTGNATKSMNLSVEASLEKLSTTYIDLLYVHWWDMTCSVEEVMQSLNRLVQSGKVLYLGISDTPAWIVSKANQYARDHGLRQFSVYQGLWSASERDFERDILPMCEAEGMAIAPWGALGRGQFKTDEQREKGGQGRNTGQPVSEKTIKVSKVLESIAKRKGTLMTSVAMAYVMTSSPYRVFPIVGGRNVDHLKGNIEALNLKLSLEEMEEIENATEYGFGFPMGFLTGNKHASNRLNAADNYLTTSVVHLDIAPKLSQLEAAGK